MKKLLYILMATSMYACSDGGDDNTPTPPPSPPSPPSSSIILTSDLDISLRFTSDKDLDLHLLMPDGREIFYGDQGDEIPQTGETVFGMMEMSNNDCIIDGRGMERINIPLQYIQDGEYVVYVNLYGNCSPFEVANYTISAVANNEDIVSPYQGVFDLTAEQNRNPQNYIEVLRFSVAKSTTQGSFGTRLSTTPIKTDEISRRKLRYIED